MANASSAQIIWDWKVNVTHMFQNFGFTSKELWTWKSLISLILLILKLALDIFWVWLLMNLFFWPLKLRSFGSKPSGHNPHHSIYFEIFTHKKSFVSGAKHPVYFLALLFSGCVLLCRCSIGLYQKYSGDSYKHFEPWANKSLLALHQKISGHDRFRPKIMWTSSEAALHFIKKKKSRSASKVFWDKSRVLCNFV